MLDSKKQVRWEGHVAPISSLAWGPGAARFKGHSRDLDLRVHRLAGDIYLKKVLALNPKGAALIKGKKVSN